MIISKNVVTLYNYCVFSFSETVPVNLSTASSIIYTWWSVSRRRLSLSSWERGSSELFVVYFNLIARWIQPSACQPYSQHCCGGGGDRMLNIARKTTLTLVISRHAVQNNIKNHTSCLLWNWNIFCNLGYCGCFSIFQVEANSGLRYIQIKLLVARKTKLTTYRPRKSMTSATHRHHKQCWMCSDIK